MALVTGVAEEELVGDEVDGLHPVLRELQAVELLLGRLHGAASVMRKVRTWKFRHMQRVCLPQRCAPGSDGGVRVLSLAHQVDVSAWHASGVICIRCDGSGSCRQLVPQLPGWWVLKTQMQASFPCQHPPTSRGLMGACPLQGQP